MPKLGKTANEPFFGPGLTETGSLLCLNNLVKLQTEPLIISFDTDTIEVKKRLAKNKGLASKKDSAARFEF